MSGHTAFEGLVITNYNSNGVQEGGEELKIYAGLNVAVLSKMLWETMH